MISTDFAKQLLNGVSRSTLLDFDSFLRSEYQLFENDEMVAFWRSDEDGDPIQLIVTCFASTYSTEFDFTKNEGRQDVERMMRQIRDWLDEGCGL